MSTRSNIGIKNANNTVTYIYSHWDGYPSHVGRLLLNYYNTEEKVRALLDLGSVSSLAESIEKPEGHSYDHRVEGYTVFYGRDRGEKDCNSYTAPFNEAIQDFDNAYGYLFDNGKWNFCKYGKNWKELAPSECEEEKEEVTLPI